MNIAEDGHLCLGYIDLNDRGKEMVQNPVIAEKLSMGRELLFIDRHFNSDARCVAAYAALAGARVTFATAECNKVLPVLGPTELWDFQQRSYILLEDGPIAVSRKVAITHRLAGGRQPEPPDPYEVMEKLKKDDLWSEYPKYPRSEWRREAGEGNTQLGYWEWVEHQLDSEGE